jgi:hypothetical protein
MIVVPGASGYPRIAAALASLPSIVLISGVPWRRMAWVRKRVAARSSRCAVSRKSEESLQVIPLKTKWHQF